MMSATVDREWRRGGSGTETRKACAWTAMMFVPEDAVEAPMGGRTVYGTGKI